MISCLHWSITVGGLHIVDPLIIPTSVLALGVGVYCGYQLWKAGRLSLALPFFGFATMMTEAGIIHSLFAYFSPFGQEVMWFIDAALTSSVALAFGFIGLEDAGVLSSASSSFYGRLFVADALIWCAWYYCMMLYPTQANLYWAMKWLYYAEILVCCGFFGVVQLVRLLCGTLSLRSVPWLLAALVSGFVGVKISLVCGWPDVRFSGQMWWFLLSDVAMFCVFRYLLLRQETTEENNY